MNQSPEETVQPFEVVLDVAVIEDIDLSGFASDDAVLNADLIAFGEAKHLNAYAELMANFIGLIHEIQPFRLRRIRTRSYMKNNHLSPFLYVSGDLYTTAQGIIKTIKKRCFDVDIYDLTSNRLVK